MNFGVMFVLFSLAAVGAVTIAYGAVSVIGKAWRIACSLEESLREATKVAKMLQNDISFLRAFATPQTTPESEDGADGQPGSTGAPAGRGTRNIIPQFPMQDFSRFPAQEEVPDASPEDSVVLSDTDEKMAELEQVEDMRDRGMEVEDDVNPPKGIEVESK